MGFDGTCWEISLEYHGKSHGMSDVIGIVGNWEFNKYGWAGNMGNQFMAWFKGTSLRETTLFLHGIGFSSTLSLQRIHWMNEFIYGEDYHSCLWVMIMISWNSWFLLYVWVKFKFLMARKNVNGGLTQQEREWKMGMILPRGDSINKRGGQSWSGWMMLLPRSLTWP